MSDEAVSARASGLVWAVFALVAAVPAGAVPAALLALLMQGVFEWGERRLLPCGLQNRPQ